MYNKKSIAGWLIDATDNFGASDLTFGGILAKRFLTTMVVLFRLRPKRTMPENRFYVSTFGGGSASERGWYRQALPCVFSLGGILAKRFLTTRVEIRAIRSHMAGVVEGGSESGQRFLYATDCDLSTGGLMGDTATDAVIVAWKINGEAGARKSVWTEIQQEAI